MFKPGSYTVCFTPSLKLAFINQIVSAPGSILCGLAFYGIFVASQGDPNKAFLPFLANIYLISYQPQKALVSVMAGAL